MEKSPRDGLSRELWPIFDLEIALGNEVAYVAEPAGTACPYAVSFQRPLHLQAIFVGTPTRKHCEPLNAARGREVLGIARLALPH